MNLDVFYQNKFRGFGATFKNFLRLISKMKNETLKGKAGRGGKREGAGRPRTVGVRYTVRLSGEVDKLLRDCVDVTKRGELKKFIEAAIKERAKRGKTG
jgi:hypothetical protein